MPHVKMVGIGPTKKDKRSNMVEYITLYILYLYILLYYHILLLLIYNYILLLYIIYIPLYYITT